MSRGDQVIVAHPIFREFSFPNGSLRYNSFWQSGAVPANRGFISEGAMRKTKSFYSLMCAILIGLLFFGGCGKSSSDSGGSSGSTSSGSGGTTSSAGGSISVAGGLISGTGD